MLYKLTVSDDAFRRLEPVPFLDFPALGKSEKDLEALLATQLLDVLFEDAALMPISQERPMQPEADIYALKRDGSMVIFELKRGLAGAEEKYRAYCEDNSASLADAHREAFNLERPLLPSEFNVKQQFMVVGNAANDSLVNAVDYWKRQGLSVDFLPYRIYLIDGQHYFEFFALPYDRHENPSTIKGVLFDTNRTYGENAVWEMMENNRVAAYGDVKHFVDYLNVKDLVFFSHKGFGIVAAAEVVGPVKNEGPDERYRDVRFLTPVAERSVGITKWMPFNQVSSVTGKSFFWARTIKVPYLGRQEAEHLLTELNNVLR